MSMVPQVMANEPGTAQNVNRALPRIVGLGTSTRAGVGGSCFGRKYRRG